MYILYPAVHTSISLEGTIVWEMVRDHSHRILCNWPG